MHLTYRSYNWDDRVPGKCISPTEVIIGMTGSQVSLAVHLTYRSYNWDDRVSGKFSSVSHLQKL